MTNASRRYKSWVWHTASCVLAMAIMTLAMSDATAATTCHVSAVGPATVTCAENPATPVRLKTTEDADKTALTKLAVGSIIEPPVADMAARDVKVVTAQINGWCVPAAILFGLVGACVYIWLITGGRMPFAGVRMLVIGQDNRYSSSKTQAAAWMGVLLVVYTATSWMRWWSGMAWHDAASVGISENLLALAAISTATAGGAKVTTGIKAGNAAVGPAAVARGPIKTSSATVPRLLDLFQNDQRQWDVGDSQMIIITLASIGLFVFNVGMLWASLPLSAHIELPAPSNALTFAFGSSLGGYLAKKIGGTVGLS